jgi:CheY-like chemotaxis protein/HPt (histidine-containing phosphotransfer) domain-containing protein
MGGEIDFMSTPGQGSSFWFTVSLPVSERPDTYEAAATAGTAAAGARILVAEDLPMNQELARAMLGRAGHHVEIANDGQEAVEAVQAHSYDLILMDIQMPRMDGITATRTIRRLPGAAGQVPIVAMTANVLPQQVAEFLAAGMNGHVAKPVRQRELQAAIASALASRPRAALEIATPAPAAPEPEPVAEDDAFDAETFAGVLEMLPRDRLATYLDALQSDVTTVAAPNAGEDTPTLIATAHKIISQAGMLGLTRLSERARTVEDAARAGEGVEEALTSFREAQGDVDTYARPRLS